MTEKLSGLRSELESINDEFLDIVEKRRELTCKIGVAKLLSNFPAFDHEREKYLYSKLSGRLEELTIKELLAFSLISEAQAGEKYPEWSKMAHLEERTLEPSAMVNPVMLFFYSRRLFGSLKFNSKFEFLRSMV